MVTSWPRAVLSVTPKLDEHPDDRADQHGDHQEPVVGRRHLGCLRGGQPGAVRLDLQGVREVHEDQLGLEDHRDGQHALQRHAEPVEAGVGAREAVDPPVPDPHRGTARCRVLNDVGHRLACSRRPGG